MLLAIDVGNTQTVIGLYGSGASRHELVDHWRMATNADRTSDEHALAVRDFLAIKGHEFTDVSGIAISSGVPSVTAALRLMATRYFSVDPMVLGPGVKTGMPILIDNPKEVGADRIANAVGAFDLYGGPTIVVDFGTATTFDVISAAGEYLGGAITPGLRISLEALFSRAAALRNVELAEPRHAIGKSTVEAIQSGTVFGYAALVDGMCDRIMDEAGEATVIATGGLSVLLEPLTRSIEHREPMLTLHGLRLIWEKNQ